MSSDPNNAIRQLDAVINIIHFLGERALTEGMFQCKNLFDEGYRISQSLVHVITGQLKGSGRVEVVGNNRIEFRYDKEYAGWEEYGNRYREGHPYFEPAVTYIMNNLPNRMGIALQRAVSMSPTTGFGITGAPFV